MSRQFVILVSTTSIQQTLCPFKSLLAMESCIINIIKFTSLILELNNMVNFFWKSAQNVFVKKKINALSLGTYFQKRSKAVFSFSLPYIKKLLLDSIALLCYKKAGASALRYTFCLCASLVIQNYDLNYDLNLWLQSQVNYSNLVKIRNQN